MNQILGNRIMTEVQPTNLMFSGAVHSHTNSGEVWMGETKSGDLIVIKKVCRELHEKHESKEEEGITYLVEHDIFKESLKSVLNAPELKLGPTFDSRNS